METRIREMICRRGEIFEKYYRLLAEWNQKFNLTAITERDEVFVKHFADSLLGEEFVGENASVLDVGTGAGFPSLPIKIVRDDISLTLVDSLQKRINFLNCVLSELGIKKAEALHARAEDLSCRETFDCAVSRAVAPLSTLCEYCLPFVKTGGVFIAYKAENCEEEVASSSKAAEILGGGRAEIFKRRLDENTERSFVIIRKVRPTPAAYPRGKNLPRKSPL